MKFLLEFARFRDVVVTSDAYLNTLINAKFNKDESLLSNIYLEEYNKNISIKWYDKIRHSIIEKIQSRSFFNSVSEFNEFIEYGLKEVFPYEIDKTITEGGRYAIHFNNNNLYLIISINYNRLFDDDAEIFIVTLCQNTTEKDIIEVYGD